MAAQSNDISTAQASGEHGDEATKSRDIDSTKDAMHDVMLVTIRDSHDDTSQGMRFRLGLRTPFEHALEAFRSRSCKNCRRRNALSFEHNDHAIDEEDTPGTLQMTGESVVEITARSNKPGLRCKLCRPMGYPTTNGAVLDTRYSLVYDAPLRRRWFGAAAASGKKRDKKARVKRTCETLPSYRTREPSPADPGYDAYDLARNVNKQARKEHDALPPNQRLITVNVRDAHDSTGEGMSFTLGRPSTFKNILDAFKAASCKSCRLADGIRFKIDAKRLKDEDTPLTLKLKIVYNDTVSVRGYSNKPGLLCSACQKTGYPTTNGTKYDGNFPFPHHIQKPRKQLIRLLFQDRDGKITGVPVTPSYQMKHAMQNHARVAECDVRTLRFFFDGERIADDDTPEEMGMQNNSLVEVHVEQIGA
ncbi:hypothetical protein LTR85_004992 [Meristemomyces frigidus]|nr:hypothetical protein LTR85_004992 [Meristemomyces frigidus]